MMYSFREMLLLRLLISFFTYSTVNVIGGETVTGTDLIYTYFFGDYV